MFWFYSVGKYGDYIFFMVINIKWNVIRLVCMLFKKCYSDIMYEEWNSYKC